MGTPDYSVHMTPDERRASSKPQTALHRRLRDTLFNRTRWPAFIVLWFVGGVALFVYLFSVFG